MQNTNSPRTSVFILAGGAGTRFWPLSRALHPKQFLALGGGSEPMIVATARRVRAMSEKPQLFVVTNQSLEAETQRVLPDAKIIAEPLGRNTAASIGLAAVVAAKDSPDTVMVVLPADHVINNEESLRSVLSEAISVARAQEVLVTIGIAPTRPHTGYGYIQRGEAISPGTRCFEVRHFFEKPNLERAESYCRAGDFYWNSGMFVFRASVLLHAMEECLPALHKDLLEIGRAWGTPAQSKTLQEKFPGLESISIDVGVMEHVKNRVVVEASDFGWNDVGSWDAWAEQFPVDAKGNVFSGDVISVESSSCIVRAEGREGFSKRSIALLGVEDLVVIDSGDAVLICPRSRVQEVKKVVDQLKASDRGELV